MINLGILIGLLIAALSVIIYFIIRALTIEEMKRSNKKD